MLTDITGNKSVAEQFLVRSLEICAHDHDLSSRILDVVRKRSGRVQVMFEAWFDPNMVDRFDAFPAEPPGSPRRQNDDPHDDNPHDDMGRFVVEYHRHVPHALTMVEDWATHPTERVSLFPDLSAADRAKYSLPAEDRLLYVGQSDLLSCVVGGEVLLDDAEFLVRAKHQWQTGICTTCVALPPWHSIVDGAFVDGLVANLRHVFVPCFDTSGYLIWTPA